MESELNAETELIEMRAIAAAGAAAGHRVMVTPLGPVWIAECPCGDLSRQAANKHQANQHGLSHLRVLGVTV